MAVDEVPLLNDWRQGDIAFLPIELGVHALDDDGPFVGSSVAEHGVAVLTQSCDLVRDVETRPFVQVAALVPASEGEIVRALAGLTPTRVVVPALGDTGLVIDLDFCGTVSKAAVATWPRTCGCEADADQRRFATALARHRQRFAFPDKFNDVIKPIRRWFEGKAGANSSNGRLVGAAREVRVLTDDWATPAHLIFYIILSEPVPAQDAVDWAAAVTSLEIKAKDPAVQLGYPEPEFRLTTYRDVSALEYVSSDRLDWDGLSDAD